MSCNILVGEASCPQFIEESTSVKYNKVNKMRYGFLFWLFKSHYPVYYWFVNYNSWSEPVLNKTLGKAKSVWDHNVVPKTKHCQKDKTLAKKSEFKDIFWLILESYFWVYNVYLYQLIRIKKNWSETDNIKNIY